MPAPDRLKATLCNSEPVSRVRGVSAGRAAALEKLGILTVRDLLEHFPKRYIDMSKVCTVAEAQIGFDCTLFGTVHEVKQKKPRWNLALTEVTVVDGTGAMIITAFRQPWLAKKLKSGDHVAVSGRMQFDYGFKRMTNPLIEVVDGAHSGKGIVLPVHPACAKVSPAMMRNIIEEALELVRGMYDPMPLSLRKKYRLMARWDALRAVHFPQTMEEAAQARRRLRYEELLLLELLLMQQSAKRSEGLRPVSHVTDGPHLRAFEDTLAFELTGEQKQARDELLGQMAEQRVMNHMLLGDVGTGKTVVAAHAVASAADTGGQAMLLAPTEVLAAQHAKTLGPMFDEAGISHGLLTGSTSNADREAMLALFAEGRLDVLIGTHALLEEDVRPRNLTLAIIDEQQRFGVDQRACLLKKGSAPDALYLTATPIPRSLALALYGDLTLSYIKERPNKGAKRETHVLAKADRGIAYDAAKEALKRGERVYVVCPLIGVAAEDRDAASSKNARGEEFEGESEYHPDVAIEADVDLWEGNVSAAVDEAKFLQSNVFPEYAVELMHGGMRSSDKNAVMERFVNGETQVLVATTVIEVGVDVPDATVMIVEDADRFGLSQLHQLRGRVGRGEKDAQVFYVSASKQEPALKRLAALESTDDGFELAQYDLSLRREGDILGNRQSGASALKLVNVVRDKNVIEAANADAREIVNSDPQLSEPEHAALAREVRLEFSEDAKAIGG